MERLRTDSPTARRIVFAFLDFINSVEPAPGVDLEGLDVVKECLEEVFELNRHSREHANQPRLLVDLFNNGEKSKESDATMESESRHLNASNGTSTSNVLHNHVPGTSRSSDFSEQAGGPSAEGTSKDELFGQFYSALDKVNFFAATPGGDEDHLQLMKATNYFEDAILEMEKSGNQVINRKNLAETFKSQGNKAMQSKSYDEAIELYTCAIVLCENAIFYCNRAAAYTQICKHNEAIEDCKKSIEIDPNYAKAYSRQGLVYYALRKYKEAVLLFLKALQLDPNNESVRENIQVAQQKWREEQQQAGHYQNGSDPWQQQSTETAGSRNQPPGIQIPFNVSDFPNVFMNMSSGVAPSHGGQDQNTRPAGQSSHERAGPPMPIDISQLLQGFNVSGMTQQGAQPEIRMDRNINLDFQQLPEELSGILGSVADMFSTHNGQRSNDSR